MKKNETLVSIEACKQLEKKFGVSMSSDDEEVEEEEERVSKRKIFQNLVQYRMQQQLLATQTHCAWKNEGGGGGEERKVIKAENIAAAKLNKLL